MYTGHTQKNGAVLIVFTIKTAPFFCVCPVYRLERRAYKNMATVNGLYNTTSTIHNGTITNKLHDSLKLLNLCPIYSKAQSSNT